VTDAGQEGRDAPGSPPTGASEGAVRHLPEVAVAEALRAQLGPAPTRAIVLGSGVGPLVSLLEDPMPPAPYPALGLPPCTVQGHSGAVHVGSLGGVRTALLSGRKHSYEGDDLEPVVRAVRALARWGVRDCVLTCAVGACRSDLTPGSLVRLVDHLNLTGRNPLVGAHHPERGPRFPDLGAAYDPELGMRLQAGASAAGLVLPSGIFAWMRGPSYETPAEVRMLRSMGADVVGMSTVPEIIAGHAMGMRMGAIAIVSNLGAGLSATPLSHEEVGEVVGHAVAALAQLLRSTPG